MGTAVDVNGLAVDVAGAVLAQLRDDEGDLLGAAEAAAARVAQMARIRPCAQRLDGAGHHGVHGHARLVELAGERAGEAGDGGLERDDMSAPARALVPGQPADIDDAGAGRAPEQRQRCLRRQEEPVELALQDAVPVGEGDPLEGGLLADRGIVDERIQPPEPRLELREDRRDRGRVEHVAGEMGDRAAMRLRNMRQPGEIEPRRAAIDGDVEARAQQRLGGGQADIARGAGHEGDGVCGHHRAPAARPRLSAALRRPAPQRGNAADDTPRRARGSRR